MKQLLGLTRSHEEEHPSSEDKQVGKGVGEGAHGRIRFRSNYQVFTAVLLEYRRASCEEYCLHRVSSILMTFTTRSGLYSRLRMAKGSSPALSMINGMYQSVWLRMKGRRSFLGCFL